MIDKSTGAWIPDLTPKGYHVFNCFKRYVLVDGPRKSSKSISVENRLCRHIWEVNGAQVAILTKTLRNAKSFGIWMDLTRLVIPMWIKANIGFKYTVEPKMQADTKMSFFRIRNMHGGESEVQLHSLDNENEVEEKFKGTRFSMVYISEADQFDDRGVFDILSDQLRVIGVPYDDHHIFCDCNPPEDGEDHWLHDVFFKGLAPGGDVSKEFLDLHERIPFVLDDNTYLDPREKEELKNKYRYDPVKYARFVEGKWVKNNTTTHFGEIFTPNIHVLGDCSSPDEEDWDIIVPPEQTVELFTGWDLGDVNHACAIACKRETGDKHPTFDIIDEIVVIDRRISIPDFTEAVLERMDFWEDFIRHNYKRERVIWRHWSDSSAFKYRAAADSYDELIVRSVSNNRIVLNGFNKGRGTVRQRVSLLKKLIFENRFYVSAQCKHTIKMLHELKPGTQKVDAVDPVDKNKHIFDAITYMAMSESPMDVERKIQPQISRKIVNVTL